MYWASVRQVYQFIPMGLFNDKLTESMAFWMCAFTWGSTGFSRRAWYSFMLMDSPIGESSPTSSALTADSIPGTTLAWSSNSHVLPSPTGCKRLQHPGFDGIFRKFDGDRH